jgi:glycogen debranching enzyme
MPELYGGFDRGDIGVPVPYPAACRPQAWSAAAAVSVLGSVLGLDPDAQAGVLRMSPSGAVGLLTVSGIRFAGSDVAVRVTADGEVAAASGATIEIG